MRIIPICAAAFWLCHSGADAQEAIRVPAATAVPVLIDGEIETDEWADARAVSLGDSLRMYVKHRDGHVFLAIRQNTRTPRPMDVFIIPSDGKVHQVHASMSTGERVLEIPFNDTVPAWDWNRHPDWTANDAEFDRSKPDTLSFSDRLIERDGAEFQLRRTRFGGRQWRVRVEVGSFPGREGLVVYPAQSRRDRPETWAVFAFEPANGTADAGTIGGGLARTGVFPFSGIRETPRLRWKFDTRGIVWGPITAANGVVYFGSQDSTLYAVDLATGRARWSVKSAGGNSSGPTVVGNTVYFGSGDSTFYSVDRHTGRERWRFMTGGGINLVPAIAGDVVYTGSHDGSIYALDPATGGLLWSYRTNGEVHTAPAVLDGLVLFGSADGSVYALEQPSTTRAVSNQNRSP